MKLHEPRHQVHSEWTPDQCRLCWLAEFDPRYGGRAGIDEDTRGTADSECVHRAPKVSGDVSARTCCGGNVTALVQICGATGQPSVITRLPGLSPEIRDCHTCDIKRRPDPLPNPSVPTMLGVPLPKLEPVRRVRISESEWPSAERHFQPSVCRHDGQLWLAHRRRWGYADIVLSRLDDDYRVTDSHVLSLPRLRLNRTGSEDPRLFAWRGDLWVAWCAYDGRSFGGKGSSTNQVLSRLTRSGEIAETVVPALTWRRAWEKNWSYFQWNDGRRDRLLAIYQAAPTHVMIDVTEKQGRLVAQSAGVPSGIGLPRGGACPVRHGDAWWHVYHGVYRDEKGRQWYSAGVYEFTADYPWSVTRWLPFPLIDPRCEAPSAVVALNRRVVFPCGAMLDGGRLVVSAGWHDRFCEVWEFDAAQVDAALVTPEAERHSLVQLAGDYAGAVSRWTAAGMPERSDEQVAAIVATCAKCYHYHGGTCDVCGCRINHGPSLSNKARMATESCPLGLWG